MGGYFGNFAPNLTTLFSDEDLFLLPRTRLRAINLARPGGGLRSGKVRLGFLFWASRAAGRPDTQSVAGH